MTSILIDRIDGLSSSAAIKGPCKVATTANITLYGEQTIDGVAVVTGDRVLVKDQTAGYENGIYCVDTLTKALTRKRGFVSSSELTADDDVLTINPTTGLSEWQRVQEVCRFPVNDLPMMEATTPVHSSLTTLNHRWPLRALDGAIDIWQSGNILEGESPYGFAYERFADHAKRDATTGRIASWSSSPPRAFEDMKLITASECISVPRMASFKNEFVELVAWFITEGHIRKLASGAVGKNVRICQSQKANPEKVQRIRELLVALYGEAVDNLSGKLKSPAWREYLHRGELVVFSLNRTASIELLNVAPDRVASAVFIGELTKPQLARFLAACIDGDGHKRRADSTSYVYVQKRLDALFPVQLAAILLGKTTVVRQSQGIYRLQIKDRDFISLPTLKRGVTETRYSGEVWCPRVPNGTWFAQREGSCYFTGNTADTGQWRRSKDFNRTNDVVKGTMVFVNSGTISAETMWAVTSDNPVMVGTDAITFSNDVLIPPDDTIGPDQLQAPAIIRDYLDTAPYVADRTALKALDTTKDTVAYFDGSNWDWDATIPIATHQADTQEGIYVAPSAVADGAWVRRFNGPAFATWFGATGDGTTDDATAIQAALTWWGSGDNRHLVFDEDKRFLMNSGVSIDCQSLISPGSIIMHGSVKSAANVAALFTFTNVRGGRFGLKVYGGGQTADYTQADPASKNEAFRFVNAYGSVIEYVEGMEYAGRVLRITSTTPGSGGFRSQWLDIKKVYCNSSAAIDAAEATRLANGVGQSFYIDTGLGAFGTIEKVFTLWELYGPIFDDTTDVTVMDIESLWRGNTGMKLRGVISFWGRLLNLGSELAGWTGDLLKIENSAVSGACQNINIDSCFAIGGYNGVVVENVGSIAGQGLNIRSLITRLNTNRGLLMSGCSEFDIGLHASYADVVAIELSGTNDNGKINCQINASKRQSIIVSSATSNVYFTGSAQNGNTDVAATTSLIDVNTTNAIFFNEFYASSANVDYLIDIVASNTTRIRNGRLIASGSAAIFNNDPNRAHGNVGLLTESSGIATVASGTASIVVNHGLIKAPQWVGLTSRTSTSVDLYVTNITTTQFTINVSAAVGSDTPVLWDAKVNYSG